MKNRGLFVMGIMMLFTALVLAIVAGLITPDMLKRDGRSRGGSTPPKPGNDQTARQAFTQVTTWAAEQNIQSEMLSLSATMQKGEPSSDWTFQLYEPERKEILVVTQGEETRILREQKALYAQRAFPSEKWSTDSDAVLSAWWQASGQSVWSRASAQSLHLHLGQDPEGALSWTVAILSEDGEVLDVFRMDAESGAILPGLEDKP
jgi:hypothetical protein